MVRIVRLEVMRGHLTCIIELAAGAPRMTSNALVERILRDFPNLPRHACVNEHGRTFGDVMARTPMPHLIEHMIIDLQVREMASAAPAKSAPAASASAAPAKSAPAAPAPAAPADVPLVGTSEWIDEAAGLARIDVSFADDQVALRALRDAVAALNDALAFAFPPVPTPAPASLRPPSAKPYHSGL